MNNHLLGMLGLAKRGGMLAVGEEPVEAVARARDARVLLVAADAADNTTRRVQHFAQEGACLWLKVPFTKAELGRAVGRSSCAILAITEIGFASAVVHRLAEEAPEQYGEAAGRLELKAKRAAERKAEMKAHEKNLRKGRRPAGEKRTAESPKKPGKTETAGPGPHAPIKTGGTAHAPAGNREKKKFRPYRSDRRRTGSPVSFVHSRPVKRGKGSFRKKEAPDGGSSKQ